MNSSEGWEEKTIGVKFSQTLTNVVELIGLNLTSIQLQQFSNYYEMLIHWNQKLNLTAITEENAVIEKHFADSLLANTVVPLSELTKVIDLGTGAGFPGIPIKIIFSNTEVTLVDSLNKRVNFLEEVINKLQLEHIYCIHARAEDLGRSQSHREQYDLVVSRAVANLPVLLELTMPFVKINHYFLAYKGSEVEREVKDASIAIKELGGELQEIKKFNLPLSGDMRSLVLIKKVKATPTKYPRKAGMPTKKPIT